MFKRSYFLSNMFSELTTIEKRLIPFLEMKTDLNGRILTSIQEIKGENIMSPTLIPVALDRLEQHGYIFKDENGNYFSNFHHHSESNETGYNYINVYKFFKDDIFKKQHKLYYNLFYYIFSSKLPGQPHTFAIEHMYENKLNKGNLNIKGFQNYNHFATCFCSMVANGHIEVKFGGATYSNPGGQAADTYLSFMKDELFKYCSRNPKSNKKTRLKTEEKHVVAARILPSLVSKDQQIDVYARRITLKDLSTIAFKYGFNLADYSINMLSKIHTYKLKLYKSFGNAGIEMYHDALNEYFENRGHFAFDSDLQDKGFINNLDKFFMLPKIKLTLHKYFEKVSTPKQENGLIQKLETLAAHLISDYPDQLSAFVENLKQKNEGLLNYVLNNSVIWNKLFIKARPNRVEKSVDDDYSWESSSNSTYGPEHAELFKKMVFDS